MTQIRPYIAGGDVAYEQSMQCSVHVSDIDAVIAYIWCHYPQWKPDVRHMVQIECGFDKRNGWNTWLIKLRNVPALWADAPIDGVPTFSVMRPR